MEFTEWIDLGLEVGPARQLLDRCTELLDMTGHDGRPRLRWYISTDAAIVLGRGQSSAAKVSGHDIVQRPSGGGAVLMNRTLLSLDVVLPTTHPWLDGDDLGAVFDPIGQAWAAALDQLGVPNLSVYRGPATASRLGPEDQRPLAEVCYASLGRGEVTTGGRKIVGLSQRRRRHGALIQCGILRKWEPQPLIDALDVPQAAEAIHAAAIGLDAVTSPPISEFTIRRALVRNL